MSTTPVCTLSCKYHRKFSKPIWNGPKGGWYTQGFRGKLFHEKNLKSKISCHFPFKLFTKQSLVSCLSMLAGSNAAGDVWNGWGGPSSGGRTCPRGAQPARLVHPAPAHAGTRHYRRGVNSYFNQDQSCMPVCYLVYYQFAKQSQSYFLLGLFSFFCVSKFVGTRYCISWIIWQEHTGI